MHDDLTHIRKKRAFELGFILYFLVLFLLVFVTDTPLVRMFIASVSILLSLIALVMLIEYDYVNMQVVLFLPIVFSGLFYIVWQARIISEINVVNGPMMAVLNLIFTYGIFVCIFFIWGNKHAFNSKSRKEELNKSSDNVQIKTVEVPLPSKEMDLTPYLDRITQSEQERDYYKSVVDEYQQYVKNSSSNIGEYDTTEYLHKYINELMSQIKRAEEPKHDEFDKKKKYYRERIVQLHKQLDDAKQALKITKENFVVNLRSIEDKCKAINFVVGRVYSDKNGGNKKIRELLNINRILYNTFSAMTKDWKDKNAKSLLYVLTLLQKKLSLYLVPEKILFKVNKTKSSSVQRNITGNEIVLDILARNDKDPVREYHAEATEICNNLVRFLKENY
ncbi:MAG: hypothetical protein ACMXYG_03245 [Candidatus Woesearchaeota archaeon]